MRLFPAALALLVTVFVSASCGKQAAAQLLPPPPASSLQPSLSSANDTRGAPEGAIAVGQEGARARAEVHYFLGMKLQKQGKSKEAIGEYNEAIRLAPRIPDPFNNRGVAYGTLGHYFQAIADFDEAIRLNPLYAGAFHNRAIVNTLLGRDGEARKDVERAVKLGVEREFVEYEMGRLRAQIQTF